MEILSMSMTSSYSFSIQLTSLSVATLLVVHKSFLKCMWPFWEVATFSEVQSPSPRYHHHLWGTGKPSVVQPCCSLYTHIPKNWFYVTSVFSFSWLSGSKVLHFLKSSFCLRYSSIYIWDTFLSLKQQGFWQKKKSP